MNKTNLFFKVATKCIRVSSTADANQIIQTLIEKFRPDMKMLEVPEYALYEVNIHICLLNSKFITSSVKRLVLMTLKINYFKFPDP